MRIHSKDSFRVRTRNEVAATTLLVLLFASLGLTTSIATSPAPAAIVTFGGLPVIRANAIPVVAGYKWKATSNSNETLSRCLATHSLSGPFHLRTQQYGSNVAKSYAFISYAENLTAKPKDIANILQNCLNSVKNPRQVGGIGPDGYANTGINQGVRSYAFVTLYQGLMFVTYWAQPGAPTQDSSPAVVMTARVLVMNQLAAQGMTNPYAVKCPVTGSGKTTQLPTEVRAMILKSFAKLSPIVINKKQVWPVDVRGESSIPHVCLRPWGFPEAWSGSVPPNATRALEVAVKHAPDPKSGDSYSFVTFAQIPDSGWKQVSSGTSP